jgi:hypothetical protein
MDEQIKADWVAALRSGEYKQGRMYLHSVDGEDHFFCCLGVLSDLAFKAGVTERTFRKGSTDCYSYGTDAEWNTSVLPPNVSRWAGLGTKCDLTVVPRAAGTLSQLNDYGVKFEEIATIIEEEL